MKPYPPLGILYISSYLKSKGLSVSVFDTTFSSWADFEQTICQEKPVVVGIYVNLMTKLRVLRQIEFLKSRGCIVIVGGPDVPAYAEEYVTFGADVAVIGEGEETLAELLPRLQTNGPHRLGGIRGILYRSEDGSLVRGLPRPLIENLDDLPLPDREAIDIRRYVEVWRHHHGMGAVSLICARGCPFTCTWCSRSVFGETHRRRSVENVLSEIETIRSQYNPDMLWFADDVFTINHRWLNDLSEQMKRRSIRIPFECISRADRLNEDIIRRMAEMGCFRVWYGSESGSQRILDAMQRRVDIDEIKTATRLAKKYGIQSGLFVMLGYPGETIDEIEATVNHLIETAPDTYTHTIAYPIKGTPMHAEAKEQIQTRAPWHETTDRDIHFQRPYSDRFYWFAIRYLVNKVAHALNSRNGSTQFFRQVSHYLKARAARVGMNLTKGSRG